jgi:hypothetical protein
LEAREDTRRDPKTDDEWRTTLILAVVIAPLCMAIVIKAAMRYFLKRRERLDHSDLTGSFCFKNAFARFRYFVRSLSSATTVSIVTPETPFLRSSRFQAFPSQRHSSLAFSRICSSLGADIGSVLVVVESNAYAAAAVPLQRARVEFVAENGDPAGSEDE